MDAITHALLVEPSVQRTPALAPLLERRPFALLPVTNRPWLDGLLRALADAGIREVDLFLGQQPERTRHYVQQGLPWGLEVRCHSVGHPDAWLDRATKRRPWVKQASLVASLQVGADALVEVLRQHGAGKSLACVDANGGRVAWVETLADTLPDATTKAVTDGADWLQTPSALWAFNLAALPGLAQDLRPERETLAHTHIGLRCRMAESVELGSPCLIGEGALIGERVKVGSHVVLGDGVMVEDDADLERCVVLEHSCVGAHALIKNAVVDGERLFDLDSQQWVFIDDPELLGATSSHTRYREGLLAQFDRGLALLGLLLTMPMLLLLALWAVGRGQRPWRREHYLLPTGRELDGRARFEPIELISLALPRKCAWRRLPWLWAVVRGRVSLLGNGLPVRQSTAGTAHTVDWPGVVVPSQNNATHAGWELSLERGPWLSLTRWSQWLLTGWRLEPPTEMSP